MCATLAETARERTAGAGVAVFEMLPAVTSAAVVAVAVTTWPGASLPAVPGQARAERPGLGSLTATEVRAVLPAFVARNVEVMTVPAALMTAGSAAQLRVIPVRGTAR